MLGRRTTVVALSAVAAVVLGAALALRGCRDDPVPTPPAVIAPAPAAPVRRVERAAPEPTPTPPETKPPKAETADSIRELESRLKVRVTRDGHRVDGCTFFAERPGAPPVSPRAEGQTSNFPDYELLDFGDGVAAPFTLLVKAKGGIEKRVPVKTLHDAVDVAITDCGRVEGIVRRADGHGTVGATVLLAGHEVKTGESGAFVVEPVAVGKHVGAEVLIDGVWRSPQCEFEIARPGDVANVALVIEPGTKFRVRVVMAADGRPVADATVKVDASDGGPNPQAELRSDADGRAVFEGLRKGDFDVRAFGDETEEAHSACVALPNDDEIELRIPDRVPHRIFGRVTTSAHKPVAGAEVSLRGDVEQEERRDDRVSRTKADGTFSLDVPVRFSRHRSMRVATIDRNAYEVVISRDNAFECSFALPADREVALTITKPSVITGTIVDSEGGRPTGALWVRYVDDDGRVDPFEAWFPIKEQPDLDTKKDPKGPGCRFTIRDASAVSGRLIVSTFRAVDHALRAVVRVTPKEGGTTDAGTITLHGQTAVRLIDDASDGYVWVMRRSDGAPGFEYVSSGSTSNRHRWDWTGENLSGGSYPLVAIATGRLAVDLGTVAIAENRQVEVTAHLPRPGEIHVVVRRGDATTAGAQVALDLPDADPASLALRDVVRLKDFAPSIERIAGPGMDLATTTDAAGRAWFRRLPPGCVDVRVVDPADQRAKTVACAMTEGASVNVEVDLNEP